MKQMNQGGKRMDALFDPRGIAIVGATEDLSRIGGQPIRALRAAGYAGAIYPVNPKYTTIDGLVCHDSVLNIDGDCDLAIIAVAAKHTPRVMRECGRKGIRFAVMFSSGFRETGDGGDTLEQALLSAAREAGVRIIGPNCQGMISVPSRNYSVFGAIAADVDLEPGGVSMVFQSGGFGFAVMSLCDSMGIRFRHCVSIGNEADISTPELIDYFVDDPGTRVIFVYIEGVSDGRAFMRAAQRARAAGKPLILWKGGKTEAGQKAAASHTANMTGSYDVYRAAFRQTGVLEVDSVDDIADSIKVLARGLLPAGNRVAALAISGGSGIVFADTAVAQGLEVAAFSVQTTARLRQVIPVFGSVGNPADITADIFNDISRFAGALDAVLDDENVDQLAILLASLPGRLALESAKAIVAAQARSNKPVIVAWSARRDRAADAYALLESAGIPVLATPERGGRAAATLHRFARHQQTAPAAQACQGSTRDAGGTPSSVHALSEIDGKRLLQAHGISVTTDHVLDPEAPAIDALDDAVFPVVVKLSSPDIAHKTEMGAVAVGIRTREQLRTTLQTMRARVRSAAPEARIDGVIVSEMIDDGVETLIGVINDSAFGPVVAFGLGGIFTEILKDVTFRVAPFELADAEEMLAELRGQAILDGSRGKPPLDRQALAETLVKVSRLAWSMRGQLRELDINPLFVRPRGKGVAAADSLVVLADGAQAAGQSVGIFQCDPSTVDG